MAPGLARPAKLLSPALRGDGFPRAGVKPRLVLEWVRGMEDVGGHHVYWNGLIHVDTGPRRPW